MKKIIAVLLGTLLIAGCASSSAAAATTAAASTEAAATATAESKPAAVSTSQTAPVSSVITGVVTDYAMSTITVNVAGSETSYLKGDGMTVDGVIVRGALVDLNVYKGTGGDDTVASVKVEKAMTVEGTLKDEAMSTVTISAATSGAASDYSLLKSDSFVREDGIAAGDMVIASYTGDLASGAAVYYLTKKDTTSADITLQGVIEDAAMSTIQMKSSADGSDRTFTKADNFTADGDLTRGMQVILTFHNAGGANFEATSAVVNTAPHWMPGTITAIGMSTVTISTEIGSGTQEYTFLKMDDCVSDENLKEGDSVKIYYEGEADSEPQAYAVLKN